MAITQSELRQMMMQAAGPDQVKAVMDNLARTSAKNVGLYIDEPAPGLPAELYDELGLETPALYTPDEYEAMLAGVAAAAAEVPRPPAGIAELDCKQDEPGDIASPMEHIRSLIVADFPQAANATDEELEALYDKWQDAQDEPIKTLWGDV